MGTVSSSAYKRLKTLYYRYNAEFRAQKFLDKDKRPAAPHHGSSSRATEGKQLPKEFYEELYEKNKQLDEYLKKVYVTSTNPAPVAKSSRPLPVNRPTTDKLVFYEPPQPKPEHITLTSVVKILYNNQQNTSKNISELALQYNLQKESVFNLLMYVSLFKSEDYTYMNKTETQNQLKIDDVEFEIYKKIEKPDNPLKAIEGKK